jgi:hypothetical protein
MRRNPLALKPPRTNESDETGIYLSIDYESSSPMPLPIWLNSTMAQSAVTAVKNSLSWLAWTKENRSSILRP